jgi:hypothetical protein
MIDKCVRHRILRGAGKFIAFDNAKIVAEAREAPAGAR